MIYLIHFEKPISPDHTCQHYLGNTKNLSARLALHQAGSRRAARLMQVAKKRGIAWQVVRLWEGGRKEEARLKSQKNSPRFCPICHPDDYRQGSLPPASPDSYYPQPEINVPAQRKD